MVIIGGETEIDPLDIINFEGSKPSSAISKKTPTNGLPKNGR